MYVSPRPREPEDGADLRLINVTVDGGFIYFVVKLRYLGSHIGQRLDSVVDIEEQLMEASQAFGALRKHTFANRDVKHETKARLYVWVLLGVLLYGCGSWFLREEEFKKLNRFQNDCIRTMLRKRGISMRQLFAELKKSRTPAPLAL